MVCLLLVVFLRLVTESLGWPLGGVGWGLGLQDYRWLGSIGGCALYGSLRVAMRSGNCFWVG